MWYNVNKVAIKMLNFTNICKFIKLKILKCKFNSKEYSTIRKQCYKKEKLQNEFNFKKLAK